MTLRLLATHIKLSSLRGWCAHSHNSNRATADVAYDQHKSATDSDLRREFEGFGSIERVRIVRDKKGRGRGYAFIVFERERDMKGTSFAIHAVHTKSADTFLCLTTFTFPFSSCLQGIRPTTYHGQEGASGCRAWSDSKGVETPSFGRRLRR